MISNIELEHEKDTKKTVREFLTEMGDEAFLLELAAKNERLNDRREVLKRIETTRAVNDKHAQILAEYGYTVRSEIASLEKRIFQIRKMLKNKAAGDQITDAMIERAREYPIEDLIEFNRRKALCISHNEKTPSMSLKDNRVYCFGCGFKGDSIDVYMKLNCVSFMDAVRALQ